MAPIIPNWLKWYKKPSYVDPQSFSNSLNFKVEARETGSGSGSGSGRESVISTRSDLSIPQNLALERILNNKTCSPMSLFDFYMYLKHIEFSQENLEFYIWFKDYQKRYHEDQTTKARSFTSTTSSTKSKPLQPIKEAKHESMIFENRMLMIHETEVLPEFVTFIESLVLYKTARYPRPCCTAFNNNDEKSLQYRTQACLLTQYPGSLPLSASSPLLTAADHNLQELHQIVALFLTPGGPKELNIPPSMRKQAISALTTSDSPETFTKIAEHVYALLKDCSHRNFVRLGINNGTFETLCMVTFVGILFSILGFLIMFIIAFASSPHLHSSNRWRGLATIPFWFIGIVFLLAGMRGSCFLLLLFSRRQELPWERVEDAASIKTMESALSGGSIKNKVVGFARKMMIFERKVRVKDVGLRRLQRKIVLQSVAGAVVGTAILEVFFLSLPIWKKGS